MINFSGKILRTFSLSQKMGDKFASNSVDEIYSLEKMHCWSALFSQY